MGSAPTKLSQGTEFRNQFIFSYVIGKGGFGKVSSAMHIDSKEWCAMKEMNINQLIKQKNGLAMVMTELLAHQQVGSHQFIVNMKSAFHDTLTCYMSFDLCVGGDLRYHLRRGHQFNEESTAFIVACIGSALHHIHSKGIIHRDVKPENILLDDYGFALLADFGVAHVNPIPASSASASTGFEETAYCYKSSGTRQYLAPEVFTKSHRHHYAADFWSLGVVTFELLHGTRPFAKHCPVALVQHVENLYASHHSLPEEVHDASCSSHHFPFACTCRSLSDCVFDSEGIPCVYLPEISRINGIISQSALRILSGLLHVDPSRRYGHGELNYQKLTTDCWYEEHQMTWQEMIDGEVAPPFNPNLREVSLDICKRYVSDTSLGDRHRQQQAECSCHDSSTCLLCRPLPLPTEVKNTLEEFHFVSPEYEKYVPLVAPPVPDLLHQHQQHQAAHLLAKNSMTRTQVRRSCSSQVHVSS
jgi:serine/threonine protein kinase